MEKTTNETSFTLFDSIIALGVDLYVHLSQYIKTCGKFPYKPVDLSSCAVKIELSDNQPSGNGYSCHST